MADCDFYKLEIKNPVTEAKFDVKEKLVVSYIGAAGVARCLWPDRRRVQCQSHAELARRLDTHADSGLVPATRAAAAQ